MGHREGIREYLKDVELFGVVVDWGCGTKPITKYLRNKGSSYYGIDQVEYEGVTDVLNIEEPIMITKADMAFCLEVIEHTWNTKQVIENIYQNLRRGGYLYLSQPFMYRVHKEDDRVRYTHQGLKQLLEEAGFTVDDIHPTVGDLDNAEGYIVRARK